MGYLVTLHWKTPPTLEQKKLFEWTLFLVTRYFVNRFSCCVFVIQIPLLARFSCVCVCARHLASSTECPNMYSCCQNRIRRQESMLFCIRKKASLFKVSALILVTMLCVFVLPHKMEWRFSACGKPPFPMFLLSNYCNCFKNINTCISGQRVTQSRAYGVRYFLNVVSTAVRFVNAIRSVRAKSQNGFSTPHIYISLLFLDFWDFISFPPPILTPTLITLPSFDVHRPSISSP